MSQSGQDFGANDWLVEEMFERYQADPTSVPPEWVVHFQNNPQAGTPTAPVAGAPKGGTPPTPKTVTPPNISMTGTTPVAPTPAAPVVATPAQTQPVVRNVNAAPATPASGPRFGKQFTPAERQAQSAKLAQMLRNR